MEVHMHGLAPLMTSDGLQTALKPFMKAVGIAADDVYDCNKPIRQRWANVTFADRADGDRFLAKHGEQRIQVVGKKDHRTGRLHLAGNEVFCTLSKNQPNPITLRGLQYRAEEKANPTRKLEKEAAPDVFDIVSLSCGQNVFDADRLVYVPEVEFHEHGDVKFSRHLLVIRLFGSQFVIKIALNTVVSLVCTPSHTLNLTLSEEPALFRETKRPVAGPSSDSANQLAALYSLMSLGSNGSNGSSSGAMEPTRARICSLDERHVQVVGQCLVYQVQVQGANLLSRFHALRKRDTVPYVAWPLATHLMPPAGLGPAKRAMDELKAELAAMYQKQHLPFGILFQLQALAANAYLHPSTVLSLAHRLRREDKLCQASSGKRFVSVDAMRMLFREIDWPRPGSDPSEYQVGPIIALLQEKEAQQAVPMHSTLSGTQARPGSATQQHYAAIYRATVTPTRTTLHGPELEATNRILRKFPDKHDFFLRVQFCDENGQDLYYNARVRYDDVWDRFRSVLRNGIQIAGQTYNFLGFSHSSLRSHSAWFSAPFIGTDGALHTHETIIKALGYFSHIRSPARCAARIGQAFSETPFSVALEDYGIDVETVPDVQSADGARVFSDGCGTCTWQALHHIWDSLPPSKACPTAFQVRFRGSKGMLSLDSRREGCAIQIRPSMTKFESDDKAVLEICDTASKPIPLVLNRQMIKILEDMGTDPAWFTAMQAREVERIASITGDTNLVAEFVQQKGIAQGLRLHRFFRQADSLGLHWRKDAFLCSVVEAIVLRELRLLKYKSRIPVDQGITLFGIMDETGLLREGEVYITLDTSNGWFRPPPTSGLVLVTRSPALHPGDVQTARAVCPPAGHPLRAHKNVIVFSAQGARDLPSQLSGGDLDGDIYNIIWDARAMPAVRFAPADYTRVQPRELDREVHKADMAAFFVEFMRTDHLGVIATRHMILADQKTAGTGDADCLRLAALHSAAVDYSKTGLPVDLRALPRGNQWRPDFLAPGPDIQVIDRCAVELQDYILEPAANEDEDHFAAQRYKYYKSDKIIGVLYRSIDEKKIWHQDVKLPRAAAAAATPSSSPPSSSFWDDLLAAAHRSCQAILHGPVQWHARLATAREIRAWYQDAVCSAMHQFSEHPIQPISELEVCIGTILGKSGGGVQSRRQRDHSIKLRDEYERICEWIVKLMRLHGPRGASKRRAGAGGGGDKERIGVVSGGAGGAGAGAAASGYELDQHESLHLCMACVYVGCEESHKAAGRVESMQSFKLVAACALLAELASYGALSSDGNGEGNGGGYVGVRGGARASK